MNVERRVLLFAAAADATGAPEVRLPGGETATVADLAQCLRARYPALQRLPFRVAVNRRFAPPELPIQAGDEIAVLPPVAGG